LGSTSVTSLTSFHGDGLDLDHVGVLRPRNIEELHAAQGDGGRRQDRQRDRAGEHELAAGHLLDHGDDLGLAGVEVDQAGQGQQHHDQQADDATGANQNAFARGRSHGTLPLPDDGH
jgi:hypothetical protein